MENKKSLKDLYDMKNNKMPLFGNEYDYFFATLEDYYIGKMYGKERIKVELSHWELEAQKEIAYKLADILEADELIEFNRNEILSMIE